MVAPNAGTSIGDHGQVSSLPPSGHGGQVSSLPASQLLLEESDPTQRQKLTSGEAVEGFKKVVDLNCLHSLINRPFQGNYMEMTARILHSVMKLYFRVTDSFFLNVGTGLICSGKNSRL